MDKSTPKPSKERGLAVANKASSRNVSNADALPFIDTRPEFIAQFKVLESIDNSPRNRALQEVNALTKATTDTIELNQSNGLIQKSPDLNSNQPIQAFGWEEIMLLAESFGIPREVIYVAISSIGILAVGAILYSGGKQEEVQQEIKKAGNDKGKEDASAFVEPTNGRELQACIDNRSYPDNVRSPGQKRHWAGTTARKLGLKDATYRARVDRVEGVRYGEGTSTSTSGGGQSSRYVPEERVEKVKTKGVGDDRDMVPGAAVGEEEHELEDVQNVRADPRLRLEYPYGGADEVPHIHAYPAGFHLKILHRNRVRRYNIVQDGERHPQADSALDAAADNGVLLGLIQNILDTQV